MGLPLFQVKSRSSKSRPASSRASLAMAPASNSSLEPQNGSASAPSNNGRSSRRHASSEHHRSRNSHRPSQRNHAHVTNNMNGGQDHSDFQGNEQTYNSAYTYARYPPEEAVRVPPEASYHEDPIYYSSTQFHINGSGPYDHEIRLEGEQPPAGQAQIPQYNSYPSGAQYSPSPAQGYYRPQTPAQQYSAQQDDTATSPTAARWRSLQLTEERLRLNLPRYATLEEIEAARQEYERTTQQADEYGPAP